MTVSLPSSTALIFFYSDEPQVDSQSERLYALNYTSWSEMVEAGVDDGVGYALFIYCSNVKHAHVVRLDFSF